MLALAMVSQRIVLSERSGFASRLCLLLRQGPPMCVHTQTPLHQAWYDAAYQRPRNLTINYSQIRPLPSSRVEPLPHMQAKQVETYQSLHNQSLTPDLDVLW